MSKISMLWVDSPQQNAFPDYRFVQDLKLDSLIVMSTGAQIGAVRDNISNYFTTDCDTIRYRQELFAELLENPTLYMYLKKLFSILSVFYQIHTEKENSLSAEQLLFSVKELETYVAFLRDSKEVFEAIEVKSTAMKKLKGVLQPLYTGSNYDSLAKSVSEQNHIINNIKSISVGINLDPQLRPYEAGVIDIHDQNYKSGDLIPRLLSLNIAKDQYSCAAPLVPFEKKLDADERTALRASVNSALNKVLLPTLKSWSGTVKKYEVSSLQELTPLMNEWQFVEACMQAMLSLKQRGDALCLPEFGETDAVEELYHPILALSQDNRHEVIKNNMSFDENGQIFLLTGPNQGGKSIYLQAVGIVYAMLHLGMLIPAKKAVLCPTDAILTHFVDKQHANTMYGRLSGECDEIQKNNKMISEHSIFLYDEALSSTNASEAVVISGEIIKAYALIGARGIWTTHFHELCLLENKLKSCKSTVGNLHAEIDESTHQRIFSIQRGTGNGESYAWDIAAQYHLTAEEIVTSHRDSGEFDKTDSNTP